MIIPLAGAAAAASTAASAANTAANAALVASRYKGGGGAPSKDICPHCGKSRSEFVKPAGRLKRISDAIGRGLDVVLIDYGPLFMVSLFVLVFGGFGLALVLYGPLAW